MYPSDHIPYYLSRLSRAHFFSDNLSPNSCIQNILTDLLQGDVDEQSSAHDTELTGQGDTAEPILAVQDSLACYKPSLSRDEQKDK